MMLFLFSVLMIGMMIAGMGFVVSGLLGMRGAPRRSYKRDTACRNMVTGFIILILANALMNIIPKEWIIGPVPSAENNYNQPQSAYREVLREAENRLEELTVPAEEILLDADRWLGMEEDGRLRLLERYANRKAEELGLREHLDVELADLEGDVAGVYHDSTRTICIDEAVFRELRPERLASIVCHEVRHAYQYALSRAWQNIDFGEEYIDLELFQTMEDCYEGLNNYCSALDDREVYHAQWVEEDARKYADREMMKLLEY